MSDTAADPATAGPASSDHRFQVDLRGVIELLSEHLYSGPRVVVRELLQNGVDALTARTAKDEDFKLSDGRVTLELLPARTTEDGTNHPPTLSVRDNGVGLTEPEVHEFLAKIGRSAKRGDIQEDTFIGRFGIGLLAGFLVAEEIVAITRSVEPDARPVEWRGRADGTYTVRTLNADLAPGTQVFLRAREDRLEHFEPETVRERAASYGSLLPFPVTFKHGRSGPDGGEEPLNEVPPWEQFPTDSPADREGLLEWAEAALGKKFLDAFPVTSDAGKVRGVALVRPESTVRSRTGDHRVYLKRMLLSEKADGLLPDWAFFVTCVLNADGLHPTASREELRDDAELAEARDELGMSLRRTLLRWAAKDRDRLHRLIDVHYRAVKRLAVEDEEFRKLAADWLPFETTAGRLRLEEIRKRSDDRLRFASTMDQFRQLAPVASAQGMVVVNACYTDEQELLETLPDVLPVTTEKVTAADLSEDFTELEDDAWDAASTLLNVASDALTPLDCTPDVRRFEPKTLPALYAIGEEASFLRDMERSKEQANELWGGLLNEMQKARPQVEGPRLCLNWSHPLIRNLAATAATPDDRGGAVARGTVRTAVELLYVQSLMLGHYPLGEAEFELFGDSLLGLIAAAVDGRGVGRADGAGKESDDG
ncbi:HSP90 family protein [Alienimonas chondri]|uniref:Chaperone protein HtpG n=1 Tax=Alienimonas chondri TaxID=2681879 RepID=A0ABX1VB24_9PLAN|nr:HSP90 family protein [Alienimonas chondri]NNJ25299.1 Chaperone protein HtpG [Alienimonas chondri]